MDNTAGPVRLFVASDIRCRRKLHQAFEIAPDLRIIGETSDAQSVVAMARNAKPDVLLVDLDLALALHLDAAPLRSQSWAVPAVVFIERVDGFGVLEAVRLGAHAIVPKAAPSGQLFASIRGVAAGQYFLTSAVAAILVRALQSTLVHNAAPATTDYHLTPREMEIVARISAGLSNKEIGQEFSISERTVKHHLTNIFQKTGVSNRLALAVLALNRRAVAEIRMEPDGTYGVFNRCFCCNASACPE